MLNALTFDVEDYFQVHGLAAAIPRESWETIPSRVQIGLDKILALLKRQKIRATFFFLGWIAERYPDTVRQVAAEGHEIALHGYHHRLIYEQTPEAFETDLRDGLSAIRKAYEGPVKGYRAPSFSIRQDTLWALDIIQKLGLRYDSSIFPFKRKRYGLPSATPQPHQIRDGLWEFPMSTVKFLGKALPVGGGGYFRLYPLSWTCQAIEHLNQSAQQPAMVYLHPWELDPGQPKVQADWANTFRHRVNLEQTEARLEALCKQFRFGPVEEVLAL